MVLVTGCFETDLWTDIMKYTNMRIASFGRADIWSEKVRCLLTIKTQTASRLRGDQQTVLYFSKLLFLVR